MMILDIEYIHIYIPRSRGPGGERGGGGGGEGNP